MEINFKSITFKPLNTEPPVVAILDKNQLHLGMGWYTGEVGPYLFIVKKVDRPMHFGLKRNKSILRIYLLDPEDHVTVAYLNQSNEEQIPIKDVAIFEAIIKLFEGSHS